jgi:ribose 1,5-bisphosphate isomerase
MIATRASRASTADRLLEDVARAAHLLYNTRPSAVSLPNALRFFFTRLEAKAKATADLSAIRQYAEDIGESFVTMSSNAVKAIGQIGSRFIDDGDVIFTYCNSAAAAEILITAHQMGKHFSVYVPETRPKYQGHISARWLDDAGIPCYLITDNAVRHLMGHADKVFVGADAVTANGAVLNKVGTSMVALAADEARLDFFVAAESYKFSPLTMLGELIQIEERDASEVVAADQLASWKHVTVRNPAFDLTPPEYIDAIITEQGQIPPQGAISILYEQYGWFTSEQALPWESHIGESS